MIEISNYHIHSQKQEKKHEKELLFLVGILLNRLNELNPLNDASIENTVKLWKIEYYNELSTLNKSSLIQLDQYVNKLITPNTEIITPAKLIQQSADNIEAKINQLMNTRTARYMYDKSEGIITAEDMLPELYRANASMFDITIDYIESKFKELAVLEQAYNYTQEQSTYFLQDLARTVENKISTFVVQSTINNMRELLFTNAEYEGYSEYYWHTCRDNRVRPTHAAMDGVWVKISEPPKITGYMHVGQDYNCRCWASKFRR